MADTRQATGLTAEQWDDRFFTQYLQENPFKPVMGTSENSIIQMKENFSKGKGDAMTISLVNRLTNSAVTGSNMLEGNEEDLTSRSFRFTVDKRRNAVRIPEMPEYRSAINLRDAARSTLKDWAMEDVRDRIITALGSINGTAYASASEAQKDVWVTDNSDRVLFGDAIGNLSAGDHSASLGNVTAAMTFGVAEAQLMKRIALAASPKIRPIRIGGQNRRYYKVYVGPRVMRDLRADTTITQAQREVQMEMENNRLFQGGDLVYDGMIFHEVDDIASLGTVGASSAAVSPVYLCGAQALAYGVAKRYQTRTKTFDYGDKYGVSIGCIDGIHKITFGSGSDDTDDLKDHGVVTGYFGAAADA